MVKDPYGQQVGMVVSLLVDGRGDASWILVRMGDGRFKRFRLSDVVVNGSEVVVENTLVKEVEALRTKAALLKRESDLLVDFGIDDRSLEEMGKDIEKSVAELHRKAVRLCEDLRRALGAIDRQIRDVRRGLACLTVMYELGRISREAYEFSNRLLMSGLRRLMAEKEDLLAAEEALNKLLKEESAEEEKEDREKARPISVEVEGTTDVIGA